MATLLRYQIYLAESDKFTEDFLMHLDADMIATSNGESIFRSSDWAGGMIFVAHPGYWRERGTRARLKFYLKFPMIASKDFVKKLRIGAIGAWETNMQSSAFVPRNSRRNYACGGVWIGNRDKFIDFLQVMSVNVQKDLKLNIVAKWHDESHLNWWVSKYKLNLRDPDFCFDPTYKNLAKINGVITAVQK
jgi:hypothetical protein